MLLVLEPSYVVENFWKARKIFEMLFLTGCMFLGSRKQCYAFAGSHICCYFLVQGLMFEGCSVFGQEVDFDKQVCRFRAKSPILCNKAGGQKIKNQILYRKMS